jgi:DNA segregation ATPase FtsK/SpoIIIE-like protein
MSKKLTKEQLKEAIISYIEETKDLELEKLNFDDDRKYLLIRSEIESKEEARKNADVLKVVEKIKKSKDMDNVSISKIQVRYGLGYSSASRAFQLATGKARSLKEATMSDEYFDDKLPEAKKYVLENKDFTISGLQIHLGTGYARSAKLLSELLQDKVFAELYNKSKKENKQELKVLSKQALEYFKVYKKANKFFDYAEFFEKLEIPPKYQQLIFELLEEKGLVSSSDFVFRIR